MTRVYIDDSAPLKQPHVVPYSALSAHEIVLPKDPLNGQEVITAELSFGTAAATVYGKDPDTAEGYQVADLRARVFADSVLVDRPAVSQVWRFVRPADSAQNAGAWFPVNANTSVVRETTTVNGSSYTQKRGQTQIEVFAPMTVSLLATSIQRREIVEIKNTCPGASDQVVVDSSTGQGFNLYTGNQPTSITLARGDYLRVQAFSSSWLVHMHWVSP